MKRAVFVAVVLAVLISHAEVLTQTKDAETVKPRPISIEEEIAKLMWVKASAERVTRAAFFATRYDQTGEGFEKIRKEYNSFLFRMNEIARVHCTFITTSGDTLAPPCPSGQCPYGPICIECKPVPWRMENRAVTR